MAIKFKDVVLDLYSRRAGAQAAYWLSVLGYNVKDRSLTNRFYLIYFCAFWGLWILAMFFLLGYIFNIVLNMIGLVAYLQQSAAVITYILAGWIVLQLWKASRQSPFMFSEEDAYLLCQTPVNRRTVGLARFLISWAGTFSLFAGLMAAISFTLVEAGMPEGPPLIFIGRYLAASFKALCILLPLQMGLQAALWGFGALRISPPMKRQQKIQWALRGVALLMALLLLVSFFAPNLRSIAITPLSLPIQAALGKGLAGFPWLAGPGVSLIYLLAGVLILNASVKKISLNQAARETKTPLAIQTARSFGSFDLANALMQRQQLSPTHSFERLPAGKGSWTLVWKDAIQSLRSIRLRRLAQWALLFFFSLSMVSNSQWALQLVTAGVWAIQAGALTTRRARKDLSRWWLFRSLPMRIRDKVRAEITLPVIGVTLLGWLAIGLSGQPFIPAFAAGLLLPLLAINASLSSLVDIFRHMETRLLLTPGLAEENVPQPSTEGLLTLLVSTLAPFLLLLWQFSQPAYPFPGIVAILLAGGITLIYGRNIKSAYRWIE